MAIEDCEKRGGDGVIRLLVECQCGKRFYFRSTSFYSGARAIHSCTSSKTRSAAPIFSSISAFKFFSSQSRLLGGKNDQADSL